MNDGRIVRRGPVRPGTWTRKGMITPGALLVLAMVCSVGRAEAYAQDADPKTQNGAAAADGLVVGDDGAPPVLGVAKTPQDRENQAWKLLTTAVNDTKRPETRIQGLAALGMMRSPRSEKMIATAMKDPDLDVRSAAVLAAGQTKDRNLTTNIRNLLDDKEPQVAFTAAMTLWKMNDRSGEDILMAVVDGERSAGPTLLHGAEQDMYRDLHDPSTLAKIGAMQAASMFLGPFGYGITAYEYIRKNGGQSARAAAVEELAQERTAPIHKELIAALADKDAAVRAASAKALVDYRDHATSMAIFALLQDPKQPVRLTAAAAYLRTTGVPGPSAAAAAREAEAGH
jgi:HEAT repeat protein